MIMNDDKTQPLPVFTADFSSMRFPRDYVGGTRVRRARTTSMQVASQAVTTVLPVVR